MSKKFGKFLLFSAVAGAAAYGAYQYLSKKEKATVLSGDDDDDFDDFSEDLDEDSSSAKERSYVSLNLDKAEAFASEALHKAKEVITDSVQKVKDTVMDSAPDRTIIDVTDQAVSREAADTTAQEDSSLSDEPDPESAPEANTDGSDAVSAPEADTSEQTGTTASPITEEFPLE